MISEDREYSNIRAIFKYRAQALHAERTPKRPLASNKASGEHFCCLDDKVGAGRIRVSQKRLFSFFEKIIQFHYESQYTRTRTHIRIHAHIYTHTHVCTRT